MRIFKKKPTYRMLCFRLLAKHYEPVSGELHAPSIFDVSEGVCGTCAPLYMYVLVDREVHIAAGDYALDALLGKIWTRRVLCTEFMRHSRFAVSTVLLPDIFMLRGVSYCEHPRFETCYFLPDDGNVAERYGTYREAVKGHLRHCVLFVVKNWRLIVAHAVVSLREYVRNALI